MSDLELQEEEREVLQSIYDGDTSFKQISPTVFQYKYGEDNDSKSFLLEISWGATYPTEKPSISMDAFYNKHISGEVKEQIVTAVSNEAEQYLTMGMTYSLFEFVKEKLEEFLVAHALSVDVVPSMEKVAISETQDDSFPSKKVEKKEQLSKSQKRKQWDRVDAKGDKPRGHDWVDIVKHLSQTGYKPGDDE